MDEEADEKEGSEGQERNHEKSLEETGKRERSYDYEERLFF
jgi:hypothetical protein